MKSEYLKNYINLKQPSKAAYQSYLQRIQSLFSSLQQDHNVNKIAKFQSELCAARDHQQLKIKDKQPIFKYFIEKNLSDFHLLQENSTIELRIIKSTKSQFEDYQLDWKNVWLKLVEQHPEIPTIRLYNELVEFLRLIRHLYAPDNSLDVVNYFMERHSLYTDNLCLYLSLFININRKTPQNILIAYLNRILELYHLNQLKASDLLIMYINAAKYKQNQIPDHVHQQLAKIVLYSLSTPSSEKKDSIEPKFSTQTSNIVFRIIGKCNPNSVQLLQQIFQLLKNFIRPFEDSKKPLKFLCLFVMGLCKRIQSEDACRQRLNKLKAKQQKRKQKISAAQPPTQQQPPIPQQQQSAITKSQLPQDQKPETKSIESKQPCKQSEQESDQEDEAQQDSDDEDQDNKVQKMITMELELQENVPDKPSSLQTKIDKLESVLANSITPEIKQLLHEFLVHHLEEIFYVNSKKMVSRILKDSFKMFPDLIPKALEALEKAGNIPQINEDGLISNIKHISKYLFTEQMVKQEQFLDNLLKLLARVKENRRITDVWDIISSFVQKIPLLDEKDMENIPEQQKTQFQQKYGQNHDRFYQNYSEEIFECAKRLFSESQYYDLNAVTSSDKHILDLINNSHPEFKKRIVREMEEQILENNNKFLLSIFHSGLRPSKKFQVSLREMIDNGNIESEENMTLDISVNTILSIDMDIHSLKQLIRRYSKKNNYKFLKQCMVSITNYNLSYQPLNSSLDYLQQKPTIVLEQQPPFALVQQKMHHVYNYMLQLVDQLHEQLKQFSEQPLRKLTYPQIVEQIYSSKENTFKNMKVEKRKNINEILEILKTITEHLFHQFQEYNPTLNSIDFKKAPYDRQSLLTMPKFVQSIDALVYNQIFLHDPNIMHNLSSLIENEVFFMYRHHIRLEKQILKKYSKKNSREELPKESNLNYMNCIMIGKARIAHFSILLNQYRDSVDITPVKRQIEVLLAAPGNDKSNTINKILVKKSKNIQEQADRMIQLLSLNIDSRFFYQKIFSLLTDFLSSNYKFSKQQICRTVSAHVPLIQSQNIKIKEQSLKSIEKFFKAMHKSDIYGTVEEQMREYLKKDKLELIWVISLLIVIKEGKRDTPAEQFLNSLQQYLQLLEPLVLSETRIVRRLAIFAYSFCFRRAKQAVKVIETITCPQIEYSKQKSTKQLFQTGFLREDQVSCQNIASKQMLKKLAPYSSYRVKKYLELDVYAQIEKQAFMFVLSNPQLGLKILKQFHIDMAASVEQVISMMQNKKHDLGQIAVRNLQGCYVYAKLYKLHYDRFEHHFGESFFKYLLFKDAKQYNFSFFKTTKGEIENLLNNLETYDNQTILLIYLTDLMAAYEKYQGDVEENTRVEVQKFIEKAIEEMLYKGSGAIFKQLLMALARCKYPQSLAFITKYFRKLINNKEKVSRVSLMLFTLCEDDLTLYQQTTKFALTERIEINHSYINTLLNSVVTLPEKYMFTKEIAEKFKIVDLEKEVSLGNMQKLNNHQIYLPSTNDFNKFLVNTIEKYLDIISQPTTEDEAATRQKNELIKATYSIATSAITTYCQFYQTTENIQTIIDLLQLLFKLFQYKMDLAVDYKQIQQTIKNLLSNKHDLIDNFQRILTTIVNNLHKLPVKKQADLIKIISNRPGNFHFVSRDYYQRFIAKLLQFEEHSMIYKELLLSISTLLAYVPLQQTQIQKLVAQISKGQSLLFMQAYVMSTEDIGSPLVDRILSGSTRERRNLFCKQMLQLRGKKEYLDDEQVYSQWKKIKQYSNPYHYHA